MTTPLTKTLKRELKIKDKAFVITLTPETLKITQKGKRKGLQLKWEDLVSGEAALAVALNASVAQAVDLPPNAKSRRRRSRK
jgi:hypothetical protein